MAAMKPFDHVDRANIMAEAPENRFLRAREIHGFYKMFDPDGILSGGWPQLFEQNELGIQDPDVSVTNRQEMGIIDSDGLFADTGDVNNPFIGIPGQGGISHSEGLDAIDDSLPDYEPTVRRAELDAISGALADDTLPAALDGQDIDMHQSNSMNFYDKSQLDSYVSAPGGMFSKHDMTDTAVITIEHEGIHNQPENKVQPSPEHCKTTTSEKPFSQCELKDGEDVVMGDTAVTKGAVVDLLNSQSPPLAAHKKIQTNRSTREGTETHLAIIGLSINSSPPKYGEIDADTSKEDISYPGTEHRDTGDEMHDAHFTVDEYPIAASGNVLEPYFKEEVLCEVSSVIEHHIRAESVTSNGFVAPGEAATQLAKTSINSQNTAQKAIPSLYPCATNIGSHAADPFSSSPLSPVPSTFDDNTYGSNKTKSSPVSRSGAHSSIQPVETANFPGYAPHGRQPQPSAKVLPRSRSGNLRELIDSTKHQTTPPPPSRVPNKKKKVMVEAKSNQDLLPMFVFKSRPAVDKLKLPELQRIFRGVEELKRDANAVPKATMVTKYNEWNECMAKLKNEQAKLKRKEKKKKGTEAEASTAAEEEEEEVMEAAEAGEMKAEREVDENDDAEEEEESNSGRDHPEMVTPGPPMNSSFVNQPISLSYSNVTERMVAIARECGSPTMVRKSRSPAARNTGSLPPHVASRSIIVDNPTPSSKAKSPARS